VTEFTTAWMLGCVCGFFMGVAVAGRRRPTCRELMRNRDPDWRRSFRFCAALAQPEPARQPTFAELLMPPPSTALAQPKPPSLKERSLRLLEASNTLGVRLTADQATTIRRALEALND